MKKKQRDSVAEMSEQIDQLSKMKAKYFFPSVFLHNCFLLYRVDQDKSKIIVEVSEVRAATDEVARSKVITIDCISQCKYINFRHLQKNHTEICLLY